MTHTYWPGERRSRSFFQLQKKPKSTKLSAQTGELYKAAVVVRDRENYHICACSVDVTTQRSVPAVLAKNREEKDIKRTGLTVLREMASTHSMQLISSWQEEGMSSHFFSNALWPQMIHLYQEVFGKEQNLIWMSELYWYSHHETCLKVQLSQISMFLPEKADHP